MTLNKTICKQCRHKTKIHLDALNKKHNINSLTNVDWTEVDEEWWNINHQVMCNSYGNKFLNIYQKDQNLDDCPYNLEHIVMNETE